MDFGSIYDVVLPYIQGGSAIAIPTTAIIAAKKCITLAGAALKGFKDNQKSIVENQEKSINMLSSNLEKGVVVQVADVITPEIMASQKVYTDKVDRLISLVEVQAKEISEFRSISADTKKLTDNYFATQNPINQPIVLKLKNGAVDMAEKAVKEIEEAAYLVKKDIFID